MQLFYLTRHHAWKTHFDSRDQARVARKQMGVCAKAEPRTWNEQDVQTRTVFKAVVWNNGNTLSAPETAMPLGYCEQLYILRRKLTSHRLEI